MNRKQAIENALEIFPMIQENIEMMQAEQVKFDDRYRFELLFLCNRIERDIRDIKKLLKK